MSDMVEKVAAAMKSEWERKLWPEEFGTTGSAYNRMAKAAIAAMREPTETMLRSCGTERLSAIVVWDEMIDAALK